MSLAYARIYVDIPTETKARLKDRAAVLGVSQKQLVANLIEKECEQQKPARKSRKKKGSK